MAMNKYTRSFAALLLAVLFGGCASYYEISDVIPNDIKVEGDSKPLAAVYVGNVSYQFLSLLPFYTGETPDEIKGDFGHRRGKYFADEATAANNLKTIKAAAKKLGSNKICNIATTIDDTGLWSLYLFNRHTVRTTCLILE